MEWPVKCALPGRNGTLPKMQRRHQMRNDMLELYVIHQARLLHPLDAPQWTDIFEDTTKRLLAARPLQSLSKRGRLGVAMSIVGSRNVKLFAPTVLAVLACDWHNEWASFKLLEGVVRQASLSWVRSMSMCMSECGRGEDQEDQVPREWSRKVMASTLEEGVEAVVARSWRALHIGGVARERVEKTGRELRALAARCRGAVDRSKARQLMGSYLKSYRLGGFAQAFVSWGQDQLRETPKPSIFDDAFGFLEERMVEASRARAGQWRAAQVNHARVTNVTNVTNTPLDGGKVREDSTPLRELENDTGSPYTLSRRGKRLQRSSAVSSSARTVGGGRVESLQETWPATLREDTPKSPVESGACSKQSALCGEGIVAAAEGRGDRQSGNGGEKGGVLGMSVDHLAEGENAGEDGKRRLLDVLRVGAKVLVKRDATIASPSLSLGRAGVLTAVRGDGTYDILYDDGEVGDMLRRGDVVGGYEMGLLEDSLKLSRGDARSRSEDLSRDGAGGTMKVRRGKKRILVSLVDEDPVSPLSAPESWQDSPQGMTHGEDVRVDDAPLSSPAVGADAVDQRGTAGRILRKYRKRRILQEDGDDENSDHTDGAAPATVELLITSDGAGRESPVRTPCTSVGVGVGERGPGPNEGGIKNSRTRLDNLLDAANDWADRTGNDGDASAKINLGAEGIDATHGRSTSPQMEDASPFGKVLEGNSQRDLDEREEGMKGASLASTTENTVTRGAGIDPLVAGGGIEKAGSTGIMDRQRGATRDGRGRIAGAELDSKNDPNNHSRREEMSAVGSAKETDGGLEMDTDEMDTEEMDIDEMDTDDGDGNGVLERAAVGQNMYKMCDRSNQGGNAVENVRGGTVAKRFASPSPSPLPPVARAEENVVLTRAQGNMVHREMPSVEGLAEGGKPRRKNTLSTERDKLESDDEDDPTEGGRVRPKQGQEETDLEVETDKNGPSRGGQEDEEKGGGRLPPSGREACQGYERGDTPRSYPPQPAGQGDHLAAAAAANTPPPNSPTYRWARLPVRRTRRPLSLEAESGVGERANGPLLEGSPQGSQGGPRDHGDGDDEECINLGQGHQEQGHDVREMRLWPRHEQPVGSEEETNVEGVVRKGDGEVTTGASDQPAVSTERVDGKGDEVGETEFATPTAMMRTPAATRRITTADLADSVDSSSAAREENEKEVRIARDAEGGEGSAGGEEGEGRAHDARVDSQVPKPPPKFMRVYGSVGITRVRRSIQNMFGQR